ncbi:MAG: glycerol dehydratase reactivase beta/small subunit family protein [Terracidiphilus sp.]
MAEPSLASAGRKPAVRIVSCHADERTLQPILWGLEEEGIPAEIEQSCEGEASELAMQAAHLSSLNVGIALNGTKGEIVLHHRDLAGEYPLFTLATKDTGDRQLRVLGANAARLVKTEPLILADDLPAERTHHPAVAGKDSDAEKMLDLIVRTVVELLTKE